MLIFLTVGLGLAAPYVILQLATGLAEISAETRRVDGKIQDRHGLPDARHGRLAVHAHHRIFRRRCDLWLGLFLVVLALAAWIWGQFVQRGRTRRGLALAISIAILLGAYAYFLEKELNWRHPMMAAKQGSLKSSPDGIDWQPWSPDALKQARTTGRPILVDYTAKWCLICQLNKKEALEIPSVRAKLKQIGAIALEENSYTKDAIVVAELNRYQRAGVPLVLVYPKNPNSPPEVLPELLTPGIVLDALDKAAAD